ncbi:MAG: hypothetical protein J3Q66DRAFT_394610 [Benniella sp.]|nr:MAG: hypothetical protein J3Q66DRAFT_394610 [Benniella sp.]
MVFSGIVSSPRGTLSSSQAMELARVCLEDANQIKGAKIPLVLCHATEVSLSQAKRTAKHADDPTLKDGIVNAYIGLGKLLHDRGRHVDAQASFKKAQKLGAQLQSTGQPAKCTCHCHADDAMFIGKSMSPPVTDSLVANPSALPPSTLPSVSELTQNTEIPVTPEHTLTTNTRPLDLGLNPPEPDTNIPLPVADGVVDTPTAPTGQKKRRYRHTILVCVPHGINDLDDILDLDMRTWLQLIKNKPDEHERLKTLATDVFHSGIEQYGLLDIRQLEELVQLIQGADKTCLDADDLVKVLELFSTRLIRTHQQSTKRLYQLTLAMSHVLDAMADAGVEGLDRETLHAPLTSYLDGLKESTDAYLVYQAIIPSGLVDITALESSPTHC